MNRRDEVIPNAETRAALEEIQEIKAYPERYKIYATFQELLDEVLNENEEGFTVTDTMIQFSVDASTGRQAEDICGRLGFDLQTYLKMCVSRLVIEEGIPFPMNVGEMLRRHAMPEMEEEQEYGGFTLDEINAEIAAARRDIEARRASAS